ncbi:hypothetical protein [Mesorhizobium sp. YM1C-6-2]|uniref:hypothetical protein n=1 Tax=Mesorhizobium sp. YM1C-6-2 TaxID=1827501 RepID=UPI000EF18F02|nr:hypothetical protein [Mesorhizobium sp. YM1C-6-2]RLP24203.1 hypothetical protein D8676_16070 [Mesorhizobium sp. YM1C-6-2]
MDATAAHGGSYRFVPTAEGLMELFRRYEDERSLGGMAEALQHVSPSQRVDTVVTILGLNASGGWRHSEGESAKDLWLRYLTPVLAETRESAAALSLALDAGLPGTFDPPIDPPPVQEPFRFGLFKPPPPKPEPPPVPAWRLQLAEKLERLRFALEGWRARLLALAAVVLIALGMAWPLGLGAAWDRWWNPIASDCTDPGCVNLRPDIGGESQVRQRTDFSPDTNPDDPTGDDYRAALAVTVAAVDQHNGSITPRALAQIYAGESDFIADAETFLTAMLERWPEDPDTPLRRNAAGTQGLTQYASAFATLETGRPVAPRSLERNTSEDEFLRGRLGLFNSDGAAEAARAPVAQTWPTWLPWLAFLPLLPALAIAAATYRPAVRASLTNPESGARGAPIELPLDGLVVSAPAPERRLARQIAWREPVAGRRIHGERSIRATLARGGFLTPVMRRRRRLAEYVFLVPRRRLDDHERDRVSRFIDALARGGLSVQAYDYDPDPRSLMPRRTDETFTPSFDLRGLRERHPEARLVLVTDGTELVDYFTLKPLAFVAEELAKWPARMLLTPVPMAEWGEREMNIADALGGLVGRATPDGFRDLATAFGDQPKPLPRPVAASRLPGGEKGMIQRVVSWLVETERRLGMADSVAARPPAVRFDDPFLRSDAPPPDADVRALLLELHRWLGPRGFHWLAACAVYPQLRFGVTVYLGLKITAHYGVEVPLFSEKLLAQLTLLPWFRSGYMPPWLRKALLDALPEEERGDIRAAVDAMLNGRPVLPDGVALPPEARLPVWRPETEGLDVPPDAVMADLMMRDENAPQVKGDAFERIFGPHMRRALTVRGLVIAGVLAWCLAAWWLWPRPADTPHAQGAWLPLLLYLAVTAVVAVAYLLLRRRSRLRLPDETAFAFAEAAR